MWKITSYEIYYVINGRNLLYATSKDISLANKYLNEIPKSYPNLDIGLRFLVEVKRSVIKEKFRRKGGEENDSNIR